MDPRQLAPVEYFFLNIHVFRDLGTEGAFDSDIGLRKCLSGRNALIPGPRYYCVTRALISTGSYGESLYESSSENPALTTLNL
jgi:hypothetical protein